MPRRRVTLRESYRLARGAKREAKRFDPTWRYEHRADDYAVTELIQTLWMWLFGVPGSDDSQSNER